MIWRIVEEKIRNKSFEKLHVFEQKVFVWARIKTYFGTPDNMNFTICSIFSIKYHSAGDIWLPRHEFSWPVICSMCMQLCRVQMTYLHVPLSQLSCWGSRDLIVGMAEVGWGLAAYRVRNYVRSKWLLDSFTKLEIDNWNPKSNSQEYLEREHSWSE